MTAVGVPQIWMGDEWGEEKILGKISEKYFFIEYCYMKKKVIDLIRFEFF
jgi:hypothetical protein